MSILTVGI